jgi:Fe(3+) dicitrate transport protein
MKFNFNFNFRRAVGRGLAGAALMGLTLGGAPPAPAAEPASVVLEGTVLDTSGGVIAGAGVSLRREAIGFATSARTDGQGRFRISAPPGRYEITAEHDGFSLARQRLALTGERGASVTLTLRPGALAEEVTVIGTRLAGGVEALRRIPGSFEVLGPDQLERARVFNVSEALRKVSGLNVRDEEGFGLRPNIGIRGLNPTRSSKALLLEDGIPLAFAPYGDNASYYHPPVERFESIEVLKGSGQVSYGPVTVGGVINYLTPDPPAARTATVRLAGGNRDYLNAQVQGGGTWGRTGLLLDFMHKQGDGARDNVHSALNDATAKAVFSASPHHIFTLKANFYGEDSQVTYSGLRQAEYEADPRQNPFANDAFTGRRFGASAKHSWIVGGQGVLVTHLYVSRFSRDWWRQSSNSGQRPNDAGDPACGGMANLLTTCGNEGRLRDYDHAGVEPRLRLGHHIFGVRGEMEAGARAHFEIQDRRQENGATPQARSGAVVEDNQRRNQAYSGFVQERLLLGRFTVTPGVRFEHIRYERTNRLANGGAGVTGRTHLDQWVPGIGVAWSRDDRLALFGGVHRGFAPPRTEDIVNNTTGGSVDLDPELSWSYEAGVRTHLKPGLRLEATLFRMDFENQIVPASLAGGAGATLTNGGETLHQGVEVSARADTAALFGWQENLSLRVALTALPEARFEGTRFSNVPGSATISVSGNRLPYAPERTVTASLGYTHPRGLSAAVEAVHVSDQFGDDLNSILPSADGQRGLIPAYTVWNATASYDIAALHSTVFVTVKNLADRLYIADRARGIVPGSPRLVQAGLSARF